MSAECPECNAPAVVPEDAVAGELIFCDTCGVELELVSREPLRLELFEEEEK